MNTKELISTAQRATDSALADRMRDVSVFEREAMGSRATQIGRDGAIAALLSHYEQMMRHLVDKCAEQYRWLYTHAVYQRNALDYLWVTASDKRLDTMHRACAERLRDATVRLDYSTNGDTSFFVNLLDARYKRVRDDMEQRFEGIYVEQQDKIQRSRLNLLETLGWAVLGVVATIFVTTFSH